MLKTNSILFKDLLISLSGKNGKNLVIGFSVIYFIAFILFLSGLKGEYSYENMSTYGKGLFVGTGSIQLCVLMFIGYMKALTSISGEKTNKTFSFIKISPIKSFDFVLGKFLSIFLYIFLLFIISIPFLSIGLILGGINIIDVLIYIIYSMSYISFSILLGLFISILSKKFSIILGIGIIPILIFIIIILFGFFPFEVFDLNQKNIGSNINNSIFPLALFNNISETNTYINLFGFNIHYIVYHIILYISSNIFIFLLIFKKYKINQDLNIKTYHYLETGILFFIFLLLSPFFGKNYFYLVFLFFIFNYIFFLFSDISFKKKKYLEIIKYFFTTFILVILFLIISNSFAIATIILYFSIFLFFFSLYFFFVKTFKNITKALLNLYYFIVLILFFYIVPLISTNLLEIKYSNLNNVLRSSYYYDKLIGANYNCNYKDPNIKINFFKCGIINNTSFYKYIIFYIIFSLLLIGGGVVIGRKKLSK